MCALKLVYSYNIGRLESLDCNLMCELIVIVLISAIFIFMVFFVESKNKYAGAEPNPSDGIAADCNPETRLHSPGGNEQR